MSKKSKKIPKIKEFKEEENEEEKKNIVVDRRVKKHKTYMQKLEKIKNEIGSDLSSIRKS